MHATPVPAWSELLGLVGDELRERTVALALREVPGAAAVLFARFDRRQGGFLGVVASGGRTADGAPTRLRDHEEERLRELVEERAPWHGPAFDEVEAGGWEALSPDGRQFLAVPIASRGLRPYPLGSLCVIGEAAFAPGAVTVLAELALAVAIAIEVADREHDAVARVRDMEATVRNLRASAQVARAVAAELDLPALFELVVEQGRLLSGARGMVALVEREDRLEPVAEAGMLSDAERRGVAPASYVAPMVFRGERLGLLSAFAGEPVTAPTAPEDVPATGHSLADGAPHALGGEAEQLLRSFAASAATAVAATRSASEARVRRTVRAAELERRRWARELHDETLQGLAAVRLLLETGMDGADTAARRAAVEHAVRRLGEETARLRDLITDLRPAVLDRGGLEAALRALRDRVATDHGLVAALDVDLGAGDRPSPELETVAYRLVQEALGNAARHAHARRVTVSVVRADGSLDVRVVDDGAGFDPAAVDASRHFGLVGMRERAQLLGGTLRIVSSPGAGASVRAELPLDPR